MNYLTIVKKCTDGLMPQYYYEIESTGYNPLGGFEFSTRDEAETAISFLNTGMFELTN